MFDITREHPDYPVKQALWRRYRDLYTGGEQLRNHATEYLLPRQKEPGEVYAERLRRVFYENYVGSIVDWFIATLFRREPLLAIEGPDAAGRAFFSEFIDDADLRGTNLTDVLRQHFVNALVDGASYCLIDFPRVSSGAATRAEEDDLGVSRAYLVSYAPSDLINWSLDDRGNFEWVVLRSDNLRKDHVEDEQWSQETRWIYYDKQYFRIYSRIGGATEEVVLLDSGTHGLASLGRVPLVRLEIPEGLWLLNRAGSLQLEHFNKSNALSWALEMGLFAMPVIYSDRQWNQIIGESYFIQLGPDDRFGWTEPEGRVYDIAANNLTRLQGEIYRVCYLPQMGGPVDAAVAQSGLSKMRDFSVTQEVLRAYGDAVKDFARRVLRTVVAVREDGLSIDVSGMDEFDVGDFASELDNATHLLGLGIPSPTLIRQVHKKLALKYLCDVRQDIKDRIDAEIEAEP